jgi:hypothetical protein
MPGGSDYNTQKLKWQDIKARTRGDLTAMIWKNKTEVYMLTTMHNPSAEVNFCSERLFVCNIAG